MLEVTREVEVSASPDEVWAMIGDFGKIADWHPACVASSSETVGDHVQRTIVVGDGARLVERREQQDDNGHSYSYSIVEGPLPVKNYLSTLGVEESGDGSVIRWSGQFDAADVPDDQAMEVIGGIYVLGLNALKKRFG